MGRVRTDPQGAVKEFRAAARVSIDADSSLGPARDRAYKPYCEAVDDIALCLAQQPLHRLQRLPSASASDPFLYDDSFLDDNVSWRTLHAYGAAIELKPGVAHGLARLAGLLKPALEIMWVEDIRDMNKFLKAEVPDVAGHLFGRERTALARVRGPFEEAFGAHCFFYCRAVLQDNDPIDHVLPWSLVGIDGLANLVLACDRCNGDKRHALPALDIVDRVRTVTKTSSSRSPLRSTGPPNTSASSTSPADSTEHSRPVCPHGRATNKPPGSTSATHGGGSAPTCDPSLLVLRACSRTTTSSATATC